jgi:hypothetical protein
MIATIVMIGIVILFLLVLNAKPLTCRECGSENLRTTFIKEKECHICNVCGTNWDQ